MKLIKLITITTIITTALFSKQLENISLQLLWKHQFEFAGFYIAKEKGFYEDSGLNLEIKEFEFGKNITNDVENEISTFGIGYPNIILDKSNGSNIVLLNAIFQSSPHVLISLKSSGINSIEDFKQKNIMIENDVIKTAPILSMLYSKNIKIEDMNRVNPSFNIGDLVSGKVDITTSYLSNEIYKLDKSNIKYNIFNPKDYGFDFYNDILFTSYNIAKNNPVMVKQFQNATLKGWEYAFNNIDETIDIILKKYNSQNKTKEALLYEAHTLKKLAYLNNKSFGDIDKIKLQRIYDIYNLMGLTSSNIDFDNFIFDYNEIYLTKKEKDFIKNTKIQASVSKNWRPFIFINENDRPSGISLDYWELITKKVGLETSYNFFDTFSNQLKSIKNKTNDVIFSTGKTSNREDYSIFSKEYIKFPLSIATLKDEDFIEDGSFLLGKVIAVGNNFTAHKMLKDAYPNMNFLLVDSIKEGLELVDKKVAYAYVDIKPTLVYNINKEDFKNIKVTGNTGLEFALRVMIRDDYPLLKSILDKSIDTITDEETNHIIQKFNNIHFEKNYDYTKVLEILVLIMIVALFILYRQFLLKKTNNKLQETVDKKTKELKKLNSNLEKRINDAIAENSKKDTILFSQSKMAAMGEMIGNIAHQWRQPLSVISTTASGIQLKIEYDIFKKEDAIKELDSLVDATQYLSQTIDDFQDFLKPTKKSEQFNIKDIIYKHVDMFGKSFINNNIEFVLNCEDTFVVGNQNELLQVIINILNNSKDILKDKKQDNKYIFIDLYNEKNNAILSIKDNAGGIPKDILPKIFDPYFTTKHKSKGTGIGLYMSYQIIVNTFKAEITAINTDYKYNSTSQKGAIFTIKIPNK